MDVWDDDNETPEEEMGDFIAGVWTNILYVALGLAVGAIGGALVTRKYYADMAKKGQ